MLYIIEIILFYCYTCIANKTKRKSNNLNIVNKYNTAAKRILIFFIYCSLRILLNLQSQILQFPPQYLVDATRDGRGRGGAGRNGGVRGRSGRGGAKGVVKGSNVTVKAKKPTLLMQRVVEEAFLAHRFVVFLSLENSIKIL